MTSFIEFCSTKSLVKRRQFCRLNKTTHLLALLNIIIVTIFVNLPCECAETVFRKNLSDTESLEVVRGDVEYHPASPAQKADAEKAFGNLPNVAAVIPLEYRQYYDILFQVAGRPAPVLIGRLKRVFGSPQAPTDFWSFADVAKFDNKIFLTIMYGETTGIYNFSIDGRDKDTDIHDLSAISSNQELTSKAKFATAIQFRLSQAGDLKLTVRGRRGELSVWLLSQGEWVKSLVPAIQLLSKKFSIDGQDWLLELSMDYKDDFQAFPDDSRLVSGFRVLLSKTPLSPRGAKAGAPITIWSLFRPSKQGYTINEPISEAHWSADAVIDPKSNLIYLALANGKLPWIQIFDLNSKPREGGVDLGDTAIEEAYVQYYDLSYRLFRPDHTVENDFAPIDAIALQKKGDLLEVRTTDNSKGTHQRWQTSLIDLLERTWTKVDEPTLK